MPAARFAMPVPGARYWLALCLASLLGADCGDMVAHDLGLGHWRGVPGLALLLAGALLLDRRARVTTGAWFWVSVVLIRTVATNLADLATHDLHPGQAALVSLLAVALLLAGWRATPRRTGARFWIALFLAGTLGTVLGDDASHRFGLAPASLGLCALLALGFVLTRGRDRARPGRYWPIVLLARTAGTSLADLVADRGPLGLDGSALLFAVLLALAAAPASRRLAAPA